jgi:hypothetical protein
MCRYGESKTTQIMMATVPHVTSGSGISGQWIFVRHRLSHVKQCYSWQTVNYNLYECLILNNVQVWKFILIIPRVHRHFSVSETGVSINSWKLQRMGCACKKYGKKFTGILADHVAFIFSVGYMKSTNLTVYFTFPHLKVTCHCKIIYLGMSAVL